MTLLESILQFFLLDLFYTFLQSWKLCFTINLDCVVQYLCDFGASHYYFYSLLLTSLLPHGFWTELKQTQGALEQWSHLMIWLTSWRKSKSLKKTTHWKTSRREQEVGISKRIHNIFSKNKNWYDGSESDRRGELDQEQTKKALRSLKLCAKVLPSRL